MALKQALLDQYLEETIKTTPIAFQQLHGLTDKDMEMLAEMFKSDLRTIKAQRDWENKNQEPKEAVKDAGKEKKRGKRSRKLR